MPSALSSAMPLRASLPCSRAASISRRTATSSASAIRASVAVRSTRCWTSQAGCDWPPLCRRSEPSARIAQGAIRIGGVALDTTRAERWRPAPWPSAATRKGVLQALQRLQRLAGEQAPVDGLARTVLGLPGDRRSALARVALPRMERLRAWVTTRLSASAGAPPPVDLLGLGPGLTPSGDDLLCGMLVALHAVGQTDMAHALYAEIAKAAPSATSPALRRIPARRGRGTGVRGPACGNRRDPRRTDRGPRRPRRGSGPHRPHLGLGRARRCRARVAGIRHNGRAPRRSRTGPDFRVSSARTVRSAA